MTGYYTYHENQFRTLYSWWLVCIFMALCIPVRGQQNPEYRKADQRDYSYQTPYDTAEVRRNIRTGISLLITAPDSAVFYLNNALEQSKRIGYTYGITLSLAKLGDLRINMGHYDHALVYLREALLYAPQSAKGLQELSVIYNDIGRTLVYKGAYEQGLHYLYHAEKIAKKYPSRYNRINLGGTYNNIGMALSHLEREEGSNSKALYYLDLGEKISRSENSHNLTATILGNKGVIYLQHKDWERSRSCFNAALKIARKHNLLKIQYGVLNNLGDIFISQDMPEKSLPYLQEALSIEGSINPYYRVTTLSSLGQAYYQMKDYPHAEEILQQALTNARSFNLNTNIITLHRILANLYEHTGNFANAYHHHKLYTQLKDSLGSQQVKTNIYQLDLKYRTTQKDKEILEKKLMITRQENRIEKKNIWIAVTATGVIVLSILLITLIRNNRNRQNLQVEKIRALQREQEISQLKAIMLGEEKERTRLARELHDGIGSQLAAIKMNFTAVTKDYPVLMEIGPLQEIMDMIGNTATDVRNTAHNLMPDVLTRYGLSNALMLYCEQINKSGQLRTDLQMYGNINELSESFTLLLYRIIQEMIQNIIKHAQADHAVIQIRKQDQRLNIVVEDNGIGFRSTETANGLGLRQLASRIESVQGEMLIDSAEGSGTVIYIELNCSLFEKNIA